MGTRAGGGNSATCRRVSGIVCPFRARAKGRRERSSTLKFRITSSVMEEAVLLARRNSTQEPSFALTVKPSDIMMSPSLQSTVVVDNGSKYRFNINDNVNTTSTVEDSSLFASSLPQSSSTFTSSTSSSAFIHPTTSTTNSCQERRSCYTSSSSSSSSSTSKSLKSPVSSPTCDHCLDKRMRTHTCKSLTSCRHAQSSGNSHHSWFRPHGCWFKMSLVLLLVMAFVGRSSEASMDITAFEYQRKFHKPLDLGECPQREVAVDMGNNSYYIEEQRCSLHQRGIVTNLPRELNDSRNVHITSPDGIVAYLGLCGGEAASFLGILNSGDCVAVEIASRLKFHDKTLVRAFVGYYRKSLDILDSNDGNRIVEGMDRYYKDKFYLKNRSYGTLEIIFVQLRFGSVKDTLEAEKVELSTPVMSEYMKAIAERVAVPRKVVVINLSTATQETYEIKQFKKDEWDRAVRHVQILELTIQDTRARINSNSINPHLQYELFPFVHNDDISFRITNPIPWEKTSMLEVQLRQAISLAKKTSRKCRRNKTKLCRRVRELRRKLISAQAEIHKGRSNWVKLTPEEKNSFATSYTARVKSYSSVTKSLAKKVRQMRKEEKLEKLKRKQNRLNQIPMHNGERIERRQRRIRHARSRRGRNRARNG